MIDIAALRAMAAAGATVEVILAAIEADQHAQAEKLAARRAKDAERQRRKRGVRNGHAESRGPSDDVCDPPVHILPPKENSEPKKVLRSARGTRLSSDWTLDLVDQTFATEQGFSTPEIVNMVSDFRDYWHARAGPGGVKNDWRATWRRWVRTAAERRKGNGNGQRPGQVGTYSAAGPPQNGADAILAGMANLARKRGLLEPATGPEDGEFQRPLDLTGRAPSD